MSKIRTLIISIIIVLSLTTQSLAHIFLGTFPENPFGNISDAKWVTYYKPNSAFIAQVATANQLMVIKCGDTVTPRVAVIFITRDIVKSLGAWQTEYGIKGDTRDRQLWPFARTNGNNVKYIVVFRDKDTFRTYCYKATTFVNDKTINITNDSGSYFGTDLPTVDDLPKFKMAVDKWLEINGYDSLDDLFKKEVDMYNDWL